MKDGEKKLKALEIYQEMVDVLNGVDDIAGVVDIVNSLIKENGLSPVRRRLLSLVELQGEQEKPCQPRNRGDYDKIVPNYIKYGFRNKPHMRGGEDGRRGLSKDKVCVATAIDEV